MKIDSTHPLAARATSATKAPRCLVTQIINPRLEVRCLLETTHAGHCRFEREPDPPYRAPAGPITQRIREQQAGLTKENLGEAFAQVVADGQARLVFCPSPGAITVRFRIPYPPSVNNLYGLRCLKIRGRWTAVPYKTGEHGDYLGAVGNAVRVAQLRDPSLSVLPLSGLLRLTIRLYRPRQIGDWDNPLKALNDSLNGVAWGDDAQVCEGHVYRLDDKHDPRVEVEITAVPT